MPRETIYEVVRPSRVLQDDGSWKDEELSKPTVRIEVGWSRDMYVQVATTKLGSNSEPVAVDKDMVPVEPEGIWDGQWVDLDRHLINELIRVLRRARDQAFGRDE